MLRVVLAFSQLLSLIVILSGCSSGTRADAMGIPDVAIEEAMQKVEGDPLIDMDRDIPLDWWTLFNDCQLSEFMAQALAANPTIQNARANILLAAYNADLVRSNLFPHFNWGGDVLIDKLSKTGLIPFNNPLSSAPPAPPVPIPAGFNGIPVYFTQYETEILLDYDLDVWGKNRRLWEAALGKVYANIAEENFTRLIVTNSVARTYYQLQIDYQREEIAKRLVENQTNYLNLIQDRQRSSLENELAIQSAQANVSSTKDSLIAIQTDIAVQEYQLKAYLAGDFLEQISDINIERQPLPRVPLPGDLPLHLIAHRPDIISQLWLIQSAGQSIEAAKAGFYPDFNLTGLIGFQTIHLPKLFQFRSTYYNLDPAFTLPIFDGGRLKANLRGSEVNYDLAIIQYNDLVLRAVQDVLTSLALLAKSEQQFQEYKNQVGNQEEIYRLTKLRAQHNLNSDLDVLSSEYTMLLIRDREIVARGNTIQAILSLIKALGGGYEACYEEE